ncbi:GNAT family N-acetyltransferase [Nonlabens antarcticus]|uniref:GNAT family N-acetyltransferase n=1 Tax=Nonlabens antarcticus TaxID=392714 RepID=UPI00189174D9|nr:GNAT family N-acetyltransferase [Nonlabens antarcticus]
MTLSINHSELTYKTPKIEGIDDALELLKEAANRLKSKGFTQWSYWLDPPAERMQWLKEGFEDAEFTFIYQDDNLIGMYRLMVQDLKYWGLQTTPAFYLHSLVVSSEYSGLQIGSTLIYTIEKQAIDRGIHLLRLDCDAGNHALCRYYEKLSFKKVGQIQMPLSLNNLYEKEL